MQSIGSNPVKSVVTPVQIITLTQLWYQSAAAEAAVPEMQTLTKPLPRLMNIQQWLLMSRWLFQSRLSDSLDFPPVPH